jgi:hypothetical protein
MPHTMVTEHSYVNPFLKLDKTKLDGIIKKNRAMNNDSTLVHSHSTFINNSQSVLMLDSNAKCSVGLPTARLSSTNNN